MILLARQEIQQERIAKRNEEIADTINNTNEAYKKYCKSCSDKVTSVMLGELHVGGLIYVPYDVLVHGRQHRNEIKHV